MGSPEWFAAQRAMIDSKPAVKRCYDLWYRMLLEDADSVPPEYRAYPAVEIGSGLSYLRELRPEIIASDITPGNVDLALDGRCLPFRDGSVRALLLTHVFHHIPDVASFLREAERVLVPGGVVSMVDETHTPFARFFFSVFHPEPYNDRATEWSFPAGHTMLDSNQALSWMVFFRDRDRLRKIAPQLTLERWSYLPWFSYLLSGGVNLRSFIPRRLAPASRSLDRALTPLDGAFAIHWRLTVRKARFARWTGQEAYPTEEARHFHACSLPPPPGHPHRRTLRSRAPHLFPDDTPSPAYHPHRGPPPRRRGHRVRPTPPRRGPPTNPQAPSRILLSGVSLRRISTNSSISKRRAPAPGPDSPPRPSPPPGSDARAST